jgi:hypothetical protein
VAEKKNFIFIGRIIEFFNRPNHSIFSTGRIVYHQKIIRPKVQKCFWPNRTVLEGSLEVVASFEELALDIECVS